MTGLATDLAAGVAGAGAFGALVSVPRPLILYGAAVGGASALVFGGAGLLGIGGAGAAGVAALVAGLMSESLARWKGSPATLFLVPGLIPLVPGVTIYRAMAALVAGRASEGIQAGLTTFLWAGAIALGVGLAAAVFRGMVPSRRHLS